MQNPLHLGSSWFSFLGGEQPADVNRKLPPSPPGWLPVTAVTRGDRPAPARGRLSGGAPQRAPGRRCPGRLGEQPPCLGSDPRTPAASGGHGARGCAAAGALPHHMDGGEERTRRGASTLGPSPIPPRIPKTFGIPVPKSPQPPAAPRSASPRSRRRGAGRGGRAAGRRRPG